jgi:hypothetical protein
MNDEDKRIDIAVQTLLALEGYAGKGWRFLVPGEPVEKGDEYSKDGFNWYESGNWGLPSRTQDAGLKYRRRAE